MPRGPPLPPGAPPLPLGAPPYAPPLPPGAPPLPPPAALLTLSVRCCSTCCLRSRVSQM